MADSYISNALLKVAMGVPGFRALVRDGGLFEVGDEYQRSEILEKAHDEWLREGGVHTEKEKLESAFKKLIVGDRFFRRISDDSYGIYEFLGEVEITDPIPGAEDGHADDDTLAPRLDGSLLGEGEHEAYAWYLPRYASGSPEEWPIKIGVSSEGVKARLKGQATVFPEQPIICFRVAFAARKDAVLVEKLLHRALESKLISDSPGTEWFQTNPDRILETFKTIAPIFGVELEEPYSPSLVSSGEESVVQ